MSNVQQIFAHLKDRRAGVADRPHPLVTHHLSPTGALFAHNDNELWVPTRDSTAARPVKGRSSSHCVGALVDAGSNRAILFESKLEAGLAKILLADRTVAHLQDQAAPVTYVDRDGEVYRHFFDFIATKVDGRRVAYAVKPTAYVQSSGIKEKLALIRARHPGFVDQYVLATEREITHRRTAHAEWILWARRGRNDDDVRTLTPLAMGIKGTVPLRSLAEASGLGPRAFCAIVCLIDEGVLRLAGREPLGDHALIQPNPDFSR